ncbi:LEAF RUST 10 DISEASE-RESISTANCEUS RECEPTOR-LIKE PROTEIN KINASE-like 1.2 isoform X1 [Primulina huaijiensis]|uniref:LEAF RUST 10 DISEASE-RESISTANCEUS RECEPTOR-LIKE PROTEIN KINASE-like 1.2 isoform X1 n=1 Tax=Primulina huaijiensis TaxID=1492673 RepID=UPI003CC780A7
MHDFFIYLSFCIFCVIILSERSSGADYRYEACSVPVLCGGLNISFPFYIQGLQEAYCGFPGFMLNCSDLGSSVLDLPGNKYVIEGISYRNRNFRVIDSAVLNSNSSSCLPGIRNSTLYTQPQFDYVDATHLRLFGDCRETLTNDLSRYQVDCGNWDLAFYDDGRDENLIRIALEDCPRNVLVPVDGAGQSGGGNGGIGDVLEVAKKGFELNWIAADCDACEISGGRCGFNETFYKFMCFCPDRPHSATCKPDLVAGNKKKMKIIIAAVIPGAAFFMCLLAFLIWRNKKRVKNAYRLWRNVSSDPSSKLDIEGGSLYFGIPVFSYTELVEATNNFDSARELGDGGFGTVYYGKLRDGREVAIKRLYEHNYRRVEQFMNEIKILTCLKHPNLVSLYGCTSRRSRELLLVYEYVENGTVADHLHGKRAEESPLTWSIRMNIAIETATALTYLHKSDIIHRDVKTNNILLDGNFCVKVADFGLSRLFPIDATHVSTAPQGTPGYVDPEYHQCYQLTGKSDVYSFGVVLVELISSMPAVDINRHRHEINLASFALNKIQKCDFEELIDSSLGYGTDAEVTRMTTSVADLAFRCLQPEKEMRPSMDEVLDYLKDIQNGDELMFEKVKEENGNGKMLNSPETDEVMLLKIKNLTSPVAVTDKWISSSSTIESSIE